MITIGWLICGIITGIFYLYHSYHSGNIVTILDLCVSLAFCFTGPSFLGVAIITMLSNYIPTLKEYMNYQFPYRQEWQKKRNFIFFFSRYKKDMNMFVKDKKI